MALPPFLRDFSFYDSTSFNVFWVVYTFLLIAPVFPCLDPNKRPTLAKFVVNLAFLFSVLLPFAIWVFVTFVAGGEHGGKSSPSGDFSGNHDFCEANFASLPFIAEFHNTWSSTPIIFYGVCGTYCTRKYACNELRYPMAHMAIGLVGVGSTLFHATLSQLGQVLDEAPMLGIVFCFAFLRWEQGKGRTDLPFEVAVCATSALVADESEAEGKAEVEGEATMLRGRSGKGRGQGRSEKAEGKAEGEVINLKPTSGPTSRPNYPLALFLSGVCTSAVATYVLFYQYWVFLVSFIGGITMLVLGIFYDVFGPKKISQQEPQPLQWFILKITTASFLIGVISWVLDDQLCQLPLPFGFFGLARLGEIRFGVFQVHLGWHCFTGLAGYMFVMHSLAIRGAILGYRVVLLLPNARGLVGFALRGASLAFVLSQTGSKPARRKLGVEVTAAKGGTGLIWKEVDKGPELLLPYVAWS